MSLATRVLIALVLGMVAGLGIALSGSTTLAAWAVRIEPIGTLFINAIRMTVIPLVVGNLVVGVTAAPDLRTIGRVGRRALAFFLISLTVGALFAAVVAPPMFAWLRLDPAATAALRASAAGTTSGNTAAIPSFAQWIVDLVPSNPVKAAADGAMLPIIIVSLLFGLAMTRIDDARRATLVAIFRAIADASLTLVRWVLALAPLGVFALALPLTVRLGVSAAGALAGYIVVVAAVTVAFCVLVLYPAGVILGGVSPARFARAALPAQAVAFSARSSLAALPAMIESARDKLALPAEISGFYLPLAASTFRVGGAIGIPTGVLFIARLYGISIDPAQMATILLTAILATFSVPGIPGGMVLVMVPVLAAAGLPLEGVGILLAVDTIPDMFRTTTNVTGDMVGAVMLGGRARVPADVSTAESGAA
jgi:proton glutamate symport protein